MITEDSRTVLWVDDELESVRGTADWLASEGHEIVVAPTPESAFEQITKGTFDLVMVDMRLVDAHGRPASGVEFARDVRLRGDTPLAFVTAHMDEISRAAEIPGSLGIFHKADDLASLLQRLLRDVPRRDPRISRLVMIAQRLKHERDQARRERDVNSTTFEIWLAQLWSSRRR